VQRKYQQIIIGGACILHAVNCVVKVSYRFTAVSEPCNNSFLLLLIIHLLPMAGLRYNGEIRPILNFACLNNIASYVFVMAPSM